MKAIILILFFWSLKAMSGTLYYGHSSIEGDLSFSARVEVQSKDNEEVKRSIYSQLNHLIGYFQSTAIQKKYRSKGTLNDERSVTINSISPGANGAFVVNYSFTGRALFNKEIFRSGNEISLPIRLPLNPDTIYSFGMKRRINYCTNPDFDSADDYFYFWDIDLDGCPLNDSHPQIVSIKANLKRRENTVSSFPEYDKLYKKADLKITTIIGYLGSVRAGRINSGDEAFETYDGLSENLKRMGFKAGDRVEAGSSLKESFIKDIKNQFGITQRVAVDLIIADSNSETETAFETYYQDALRNSDIVAYDGHSGAGGYLHLNRFPDLVMTDLYQVYFFNGCSTYSFFNRLYINAKPGHSQNLDIISAGLLTYPETSVNNMMAFLSPFLSGKLSSYQEILLSLERSNRNEPTYLMGVSGDEDNAFRP